MVEAMRHMSWATRLAVVAILAMGAAISGSYLKQEATAQQSPGLTKDDLRNRVQAFYQVLQNRQFGRAWDLFLAPGLKRDTPREEYIVIMDSSFGGEGVVVSVSERAEVWITKTGTGDRQRPLGMAITPIVVKFKEGTTVTAEHTTKWIEQETEPKQSTWVLVGDEMKEKQVK